MKRNISHGVKRFSSLSSGTLEQGAQLKANSSLIKLGTWLHGLIVCI